MVSVREKIAYGLGDTASNFIFQTVMLFLTYYYTDIVGLSPGAVGSMFLFVRIFDAITDPMMGYLADRTRTRWGAYRPYLLWLALPFALISILAFSSPPFDDNGKLIYAVITYGLLMLFYTAINIPYSALGGVITIDSRERVTVQSYRFVFAMVGGLIVTLCTLPLVKFFGGNDPALGYQRTMMLMSFVGMLLFLVCFYGTRERRAPPILPSLPYKAQLLALWRNDQCRILCVVSVLLLTGLVLRSTLAIYYVKYVLVRPDDVTFFVTAGMVGSIIGCASAHYIAKLFCKIRVYIVLQLISAALCLSNYFVPVDAWWLAVSIHFLWGLALQMTTPLLWSKIADVADYGESQTGTRMTGITYSSIVFFIKVGIALGGALAGWLLSGLGYSPGAMEPTVNNGILWSFSILPAMAFLAVAFIMCWYRLDANKMAAIQRKLKDESLSGSSSI
jgi:GPH family glycoside/pentoside/hexuronide:cation symporter